MKRFVFIVKTEKCALDKVQNKFPSGVLLNICSASFQIFAGKRPCRRVISKKLLFHNTSVRMEAASDAFPGK